MQKILIVEDDIDIQDILKNHLIDAGYEVAVASQPLSRMTLNSSARKPARCWTISPPVTSG